MFKNTYQNGLLSIFFSCGANPLAIWDMEVRNGHIKRVTDDEVNSIVLEIIMILDDKNMRRRFRISNFQSTTKIKPFCTSMPIGLAGGWNQIQFNLADFTRRAYGTQFMETLRVQVHANARLRRIYFSERLYTEEELPQDYKLYLPLERKLKKGKAKKEEPAEAAPPETEAVPPEEEKESEAVPEPTGAEPEQVEAVAETAEEQPPLTEEEAVHAEAAPEETTAAEVAAEGAEEATAEATAEGTAEAGAESAVEGATEGGEELEGATESEPPAGDAEVAPGEADTEGKAESEGAEVGESVADATEGGESTVDATEGGESTVAPSEADEGPKEVEAVESAAKIEEGGGEPEAVAEAAAED